MKKVFALLVAAFLAVSSASAFQIGAHTGASFGAYTRSFSLSASGLDRELTGGAMYDIFVSMPHYWESVPGLYHSVEIGMIGGWFDANFNIGYSWNIKDLFKVEPFFGLGMGTFFIWGLNMNLGCNFRIPCGIGDITADIRYNPCWGFLHRESASFNVGYVFYLGKETRGVAFPGKPAKK